MDWSRIARTEPTEAQATTESSTYCAGSKQASPRSSTTAKRSDSRGRVANAAATDCAGRFPWLPTCAR
eukprot:8950908-Pyramimonas_sp.AAC.1